jgi:dihydroorotate dehydrogenase electron transfer subunit
MLRCAATFRHCGVYQNTPHSEGLARLASGAFCEAVRNNNSFFINLFKVKMAKDIYIGEVLKNEEIRQGFFLMKVALPLSFVEPVPGQFIMIRIAGMSEPFLGRPISIYSFSRGKSSCSIELLYRVAGKGTEIMAGLIKGSQVEINGPLGGSYEIYPDKDIVFIAGGIGVAPLSLLAQYLCRNVCFPQSRMTFYLGAQNAEALVGLDRIKGLCYNIHVCTDDGSIGRKSLVTEAFQKDIKKYSSEHTVVYACGPKGMMKALEKILRDTKFACQVSLEEKMACGVGACIGCAVGIKDEAGGIVYKRVCADGPIFNIRDVVWE